MTTRPEPDMSKPPFSFRGPFDRAYTRLRHFIAIIGGDMVWAPQGAGGEWVVSLRGRTRRFECHSEAVNPLDSLYVSDPANPPRTWVDFPDGERTPLVDDAFWKLVDLLREAPRDEEDPPPGCEIKTGEDLPEGSQ